ncbi:MAG: hypothetical protein WC620_10885 [Methanoregula sp.]|jgi:hypothetical protein
MPIPILDDLVCPKITPLYFWIVFTYLLILFYSFNIDEFKEKIQGVEKLFIAGAIGTVFFLLANILYEKFFQVIIKWYNQLNSASQILPYSFNVFRPQTHLAGTTFPEYFIIGIVVFLILYTICVIFFYLLTRIIGYCLDPTNEVLPKYERFQAIKNYKIKELAYTFPYFLTGIGMLFMLINVVVGFIQNVPSFQWILENRFDFFTTLFFLFITIFLICFFLSMCFDFLILTIPLLARSRVFLTNFLKTQDNFKESVWIYTYKFGKLSTDYLDIAVKNLLQIPSRICRAILNIFKKKP